MTTSKICIEHTNLVQVRLVEVRGTGHITVNDRHFALKQGMKIDITSSLCEGTNILTFFVSTSSLKDDPSRLLRGKGEWLGNFEIYIDGAMAGSYLKTQKYFIGGKENTIASVEVSVAKDLSQPTVNQIIKYLQKVEGIADADKRGFPEACLYISFRNGIGIYTWKNFFRVDHVFITDRLGQCVYAGYTGWIHSGNLQAALHSLQNEFQNYVS